MAIEVYVLETCKMVYGTEVEAAIHCHIAVKQ